MSLSGMSLERNRRHLLELFLLFPCRYKESIEKMTKIRSEVEEEKRELRERLRDAQQSERELFKELEATKEKGKGQLIQIGKLEEKLVQVSNANVELQASLLRAENTAEETDIAANAAKEEAIAKLDNENTRLSGLLTVERNERARLEEQTKAQAVQLKDMADKTSVYISVGCDVIYSGFATTLI